MSTHILVYGPGKIERELEQALRERIAARRVSRLAAGGAAETEAVAEADALICFVEEQGDPKPALRSSAR